MARDPTILKVFEDNLDPYVYFAVDLYEQPYEVLITDKEKRQIAKPAVLGCVAKNTLVLTIKGWIPIEKITPAHLVFDGLTFVQTSGTIEKGVKTVIEGLFLTPDHKTLVSENEWHKAISLENTQLGPQAIDLAIGKLLNLLDLKEEKGDTYANVFPAEHLKKYMYQIWNSERLHPAFLVPIRKLFKSGAGFISNLAISRESLLTVLLTDIMLFCRAVVEQETNLIATLGEELLANFQMYTVLFGTLSHWKGLITLISNWIESTTMATTSRGISGSLPLRSMQTIKTVLDLWTGMASAFQLQDFGPSIVHSIETLEQLAVNYERESRRNKLSPNSLNVEVPTYDILNSGPRNRFMILTSKGPLIVHNCGYQLSAGEQTTSDEGDIIYTGLMKYSRDMGIQITQEMATKSVEKFRSKHKGVVKCWSDLENAAKRCIRTNRPQEVGPLRFEMTAGVLRMILPSGRALHYLEPKLTEREWYGGKKETISCLGMDQKKHLWGTIYTYGGKLIENAVQAISRDLLAHGLQLATKMGFPCVMHTHDEIVAEVPEISPLGIKELREAMITPPVWADKYLMVDASGFESKIYRKD